MRVRRPQASARQDSIHPPEKIMSETTINSNTASTAPNHDTRNNKKSNPEKSINDILVELQFLRGILRDVPYSIAFTRETASCYQRLQYPDLAAGALYKCVLLLDALSDESDELHEAVVEQHLRDTGIAQQDGAPEREGARIKEGFIHPLTSEIYTDLATSLLDCGCFKSAYRYCLLGLRTLPDNDGLKALRERVTAAAGKAMGADPDAPRHLQPSVDDWPDTGMVRRELYPWNTVEPDRFAASSLEYLNSEMSKVAPLLEVRAVELVDLTARGDKGEERKTVRQLGVFAKTDIAPGELVLDETSLLTANNRLNDSLCDACSSDIESSASAVACDDCEVVFCSAECRDLAVGEYHEAICDRGLDSIARDVPPAQAADSLYLLLCVRALAMSVQQDCHPLDLKQVKYIWGDYQSSTDPSHDPLPRTLPFSFDMNIALPFDVLTKMDVDIFKQADRYNVWAFNTLFAKFRGTASARLSGLKGTTARGPEVSAVHPLWCLANHSCDPNVRWEWGGRMKFWTRQDRARWTGPEGLLAKNIPGLKRDEEVLSHYCDIELPVQARREWAEGALGGACRCERCEFEAKALGG